MAINKKITTTAVLVAASFAFGSAANADVCDTPSKLGDMGSFPGEVITVQGSLLGTDQEMFLNTVSCFEKATGAKIQYSGSRDFAALVVADMRSNNPPNIAIFPQPGLAADMAAEGHLVPIGDEAAAWMKDNYGAGSSWVDLGTYADANGNDHFYGFAFKMDLKSLVWYSPEQFEDNGYEIPATMEELIELSDQMVADGNTPWCIGVESGNATGWTATDWMEEIMLRTHPPSVYDQWVSNEMPFNDQKVIDAMEFFGTFALNDDYVAGGSKAVATTGFRDSPKGLFTSPPQCMMHRQASFIPAFFPEGVEAGVDYDFFYFPAYATKDLGTPVLGAGTLVAATNDNQATIEFIKFLMHPEAHEYWMAKGGFLTPHKGVDGSKYASETFRKLGEILTGATTFRFDASDLMPGAIGAGTFWTGMVDYTNGKSAQDVADAIQDSWDAIK